METSIQGSRWRKENMGKWRHGGKKVCIKIEPEKLIVDGLCVACGMTGGVLRPIDHKTDCPVGAFFCKKTLEKVE
jgi:hypothetical protein